MIKKHVRTGLMLACGLSALLVAGSAPGNAQLPSSGYDILIKNARVLDGTGNPWFLGDIAIKDGKIADIGFPSGPLGRATAKRVIDAHGLVASPGFIDLHAHSDLTLLADGNAESKIRDGVTLDVIGEGPSMAPRDGMPPETSSGSIKGGHVTEDWTTFTQYFDRLRKSGISMNLASSVSPLQIRQAVMGYSDAPATPDQLAKMEALMRRSMEEGAVSLVGRWESGGPTHPDEVIDLAKIAASYGGYYSTHAGSEGFEETKEFEFAIRVAREAHIPVHIFHFKIRGKPLWGTIGKYIDMINQARAQGLDVTANQYPYEAMQHPWSVFFPVWARAGGPKAFAARLQDPAQREKIKNDKDFKSWVTEHGSWDNIVAAQLYKPDDQKYLGMRVAQIAKLRGDKDPADTCLWLEAHEEGRIGGIYHNMSEPDIQAVMKQPWVSVASDGSALNLNAEGMPHPREYGTNARVLGHYVRELHVLTLPDAVRKMTGLPAQIMGLQDRGELHPGYWADVVLFDPDTVKDTATYEKPQSYAVGIPFVIVNGQVVIDNGKHTGARPGQVVLGHGYKQGI